MTDEQIDLLADLYLYVSYDTSHSGTPTAAIEGHRRFARALSELLSASKPAAPAQSTDPHALWKWLAAAPAQSTDPHALWKWLAAAPAQSGEPVAWLHEISEPDGSKNHLLSKLPSNPWNP